MEIFKKRIQFEENPHSYGKKCGKSWWNSLGEYSGNARDLALLNDEEDSLRGQPIEITSSRRNNSKQKSQRLHSEDRFPLSVQRRRPLMIQSKER